MIIYCISDIHGCLDAFEEALSLIDLSGDNKLMLLGDYIHGENSYGVLDRIMYLQQYYGKDKVMALLGNHEDMVLTGVMDIAYSKHHPLYDAVKEREYLAWMARLPLYHVIGNVIFVHAGIDEEAESLWEVHTDKETMIWKYPVQIGKFNCVPEMKIVAGHVGTAEISGNPSFFDIYYDGESHYYIDGTVLDSGVLPVLQVDTDKNTFYKVLSSGLWPILPYGMEA